MHDFTIGLAFVFDLLKLFLILPNIKKNLCAVCLQPLALERKLFFTAPCLSNVSNLINVTSLEVYFSFPSTRPRLIKCHVAAARNPKCDHP